MRENKEKILIVAALLVAIVGLSLGFAAFSNTLSISSTANITADSSLFSVKFSKVSDTLNESNVVAYSNPSGLIVTEGLINNATNPTLTGLNVGFTDPGQTVVYRVYARNTGNYVAHLTALDIANTSTGTPVKCTSSDATITQDLLDAACRGISISVKVGEEAATTTSTTYSSHALAKASSELVEITISYAANAPKADGNFNVEFGNIALTYSTVASEVVAPPAPPAPLIPSIPVVGGNETPTSCFISTTPGEINDYMLSSRGRCYANIKLPANLSLPVSTITSITYNETKCLNAFSTSDCEEYRDAVASSSNSDIVSGILKNVVDIQYETTDSTTYPVTAIGAVALGNKSLTSFDFGQNTSISSIGFAAFAYNNLTNIIIPNSVTTVGEYAFLNNLITNIELGNSITTIGDNAFYSDKAVANSIIINMTEDNFNNNVTKPSRWYSGTPTFTYQS